jgi:glycosidase
VPEGGDLVEHRLRRLIPWLDHAASLGCTGLLLGPVFAAQSHGYDTVDHLRIDPRLGDDEDFDALVAAAHERGMRVTLDGVFNHVGRDFAMFGRALAEGPDSAAARWFHLYWRGPGVEPDYEMFEGHDTLVTLNHDEPEVAAYVADVMTHWLDRGVDGWRLDAAYAVPPAFWRPVLARVRKRHPAAWFVGEMIHGDYAAYVAESGLDTVTQYELWKAIWSGFNDVNLFELAWALARHDELCAAFTPLTFVGNHDVTRIASKLTDPRHVSAALAVLFTVPGTPCIYAGDEFGLTGVKEDRPGGDDAVRTAFPDYPDRPDGAEPGDRLLDVHRTLVATRRRNPWLTDAHVEVPYLKNETAVIELAPRGGGPERIRLLLNLDDVEHEFPHDLGGAEPVPAHDWRVVGG